jgi:hypothetical protein
MANPFDDVIPDGGTAQQANPFDDILPSSNVTPGPELKQGAPSTFLDRIMEGTKTSKDKLANAYALSSDLNERYPGKNITPSMALDHYDELNPLRDQPTYKDLESGIMNGAVLMGLMAHPLATVLGVAAFTGLGEAESYLINKHKGTKYQYGAPKALADLTPKDTSENTRTVIDWLDFIGKGAVLGVAGAAANPLIGKFVRDCSVEYNLPRIMHISAEKVRNVFDGKEGKGSYESDMLNNLGLSKGEWNEAINDGITIEVPLERLVKITDKPYWEKIKGLIGVSPYHDVRPTQMGKPEVKQMGKAETPATPSAKPSPASSVKLSPDQAETATRVVSYFTSEGYTPEQAKGIANNIFQESGFHLEAVGDGGEAYGLAQWRLDRREILFQRAAAKGETKPSLETQLEFMKEELSGSHRQAGDLLRQAKTEQEATDSFMVHYEKPKDQTPGSRQLIGGAIDGKVIDGPPVMSRQMFEEAINKNTKIPQEQRGAYLALMDSISKSWAEREGKAPADFFGQFIADVRIGGKDVKGGLFQYAGPNAKGWDTAKGKFSSLYDKKLRFEIDDSMADFKGVKLDQDGRFSHYLPLAELYKHPELFKNYPELKDVSVNLVIDPKAGPSGAFRPGNGKALPQITVIAKDDVGAKETLTHEIQHWIQRKEDFAKGGNLETAPTIDMDAISAIRTEQNQLGIDPYRIMNKKSSGYPLEKYEIERFKKWEELREKEDELLSKMLTPGEAYRRLAGEIEARDAANRSFLSPEERAELPPYSIEKIPVEDAIVLFQGKKGAVEFLEDTRAVIHLFETADVTTLLHETGHVLEKHLTPEQNAVVNRWLGLDEAMLPDARPKAAREKFARGFETYTMEGKAPSMKLREVFSQMKGWLLDVYKSIRNLRVNLNDDMRSLFDRLISTEQERRENVLFQMVDDYKIEGDPGFDSYDKLMAEVYKTAFAKEEVRQKREQIKRENVWRKEAISNVDQDPIIAARRDIAKRGGLNEKALSRDYDADTIRMFKAKQPGLVTKNGKLEADIEAMDKGFESGDRMLEDFLSYDTRAEAIESYVDTLRKEYKPDREYEASENLVRLLEAEAEAFRGVTASATRKMQNKTAKGLSKVIREQTGQVRVSDVTQVTEYDALKAGIKKAADAARKAFVAGKKEEAVKQKQHQLELARRYRNRLAARKEYKETVGNLNKMVNDKKVDWDCREQLIKLLQPFRGINAKRTLKTSETLEAWIGRKVEEGEAILFDPEIAKNLAATPLYKMTMEELRTLSDMATHVYHVGKAQKEFLDKQRKENFEGVVLNLVRSIYHNAATVTHAEHPLMKQTVEKRDSLPGLLEKFRGARLKPEFLFKMLDGEKENGTAWRELWSPMVDVALKELEVLKVLDAKGKEIFGPFEKNFKEWSRVKKAIPDTPFHLTKWEALIFYANSLHPDNVKGLKHGYALDNKELTDAHIEAVAKILSPEEKAFIHRLIDEYIPIAWPYLSEAYRALTGVPLKKVEGPYFPIVFDKTLFDKIKESERAEQAKNFFKEYFPVSVSAGAAHGRVGGRGPVLLSPTGFLKSVAESIHYGTHVVALRDTLKLISNPSVKQAITESWGEEVYGQIQPWLHEMARPGTHAKGFLEERVGLLRRNYTAFALGARLSTTLLQPLAYSNTMKALGFTDSVNGLSEFYADFRKNSKFVQENDIYMEQRASNFDREARDVLRNWNPTDKRMTEDIKRSLMSVIGFADRLAAEPTWYSAYRKAMAGKVEGVPEGTHDQAVRYARSIVETTQGSGMPMDLAAIQRGSEYEKTLVTAFYTFFSVVDNMFGQSARMRKQLWKAGDQEGAMIELVKAYWYLAIFPGVAAAWVTGGKKDNESAGAFVARTTFLYRMGAIPVVRDLASMVVGGYDYRAGAIGAVANEISAISKIAKSKKSKEKEKKIIYHGAKAFGMLTGFPPDQALITIEGLTDLAKGKTHDPTRLMFRKQKGDKD